MPTTTPESVPRFTRRDRRSNDPRSRRPVPLLDKMGRASQRFLSGGRGARADRESDAGRAVSRPGLVGGAETMQTAFSAMWALGRGIRATGDAPDRHAAPAQGTSQKPEDDDFDDDFDAD